MLTHIVLFQVPDNDDATRLVDALRALPAAIDDIDRYEVGRDISGGDRSFDVGLYSTFADGEALERYRVHPDHQQVQDLVSEVTTDRVVVDFES